jgi:hypothetical protein
VTLKKAYEIRKLIEPEIRPDNGVYLPDAARIVAGKYGFSDQDIWDAWHGTYPGETYVYLDDLRSLPEELYQEVKKLIPDYLTKEYTLDYIVKTITFGGKEPVACELCQVLEFVKNPFRWKV